MGEHRAAHHICSTIALSHGHGAPQVRAHQTPPHQGRSQCVGVADHRRPRPRFIVAGGGDLPADALWQKGECTHPSLVHGIAHPVRPAPHHVLASVSSHQMCVCQFITHHQRVAGCYYAHESTVPDHIFDEGIERLTHQVPHAWNSEPRIWHRDGAVQQNEVSCRFTTLQAAQAACIRLA